MAFIVRVNLQELYLDKVHYKLTIKEYVICLVGLSGGGGVWREGGVYSQVLSSF